MPGYKGHMTGGLIVFALALYVLQSLNPSWCTTVEWLCCTLAGSLFPDIDVKSKGQKWLYWILFFAFALLLVCELYFVLAVLGIIALIPMMVRHRGLFHQLWFVIAVPVVVATAVAVWFPIYSKAAAYDALFFCLGAVSHLWLDMGIKRMLRL